MSQATFEPNNSAAPRLWPDLAKEIGLNESILLLQLEYWIRISTTDEREGRRWTYQSTRDIQAFFPFWSVATIQRAIQSLVKKKLIHVGNFNKYKYDKTRWFAINEDVVKRLTQCPNDSAALAVRTRPKMKRAQIKWKRVQANLVQRYHRVLQRVLQRLIRINIRINIRTCARISSENLVWMKKGGDRRPVLLLE
jgi:hypothetical protein